jgi:hypothetical protein
MPLHFIASRKYTTPQGYLHTKVVVVVTCCFGHINKDLEPAEFIPYHNGEHYIKPTKKLASKNRPQDGDKTETRYVFTNANQSAAGGDNWVKCHRPSSSGFFSLGSRAPQARSEP